MMRAACVPCAVAALLAAGCRDLPGLGVCGNGIVEEANGEACDGGGGASATCTATCELACTEEAVAAYVRVGTDDDGDPLFCPDARYRCGLDRICRAPSGAFARPGPALPFDITGSPVLGDVDNDGLPDLVGTSQTNLYVRFASAGRPPLEDLVVQVAPSSDAPYAIFDLDPGQRNPMQSDIMIAVPTEGIALLRADGERFTPELDFSMTLPSTPNGIVVRDPDPSLGDVPISIEDESDPASSEIAVARVASPLLEGEGLPDCVGSTGVGWRTVTFKVAPDLGSFVVVTQRRNDLSPTTQPWHVCLYSHAGTGWSLSELELPPPTATSIAFANLDGDPCLELAVHSQGTPGVRVIDAGGAGCALVPGLLLLPLADAGSAVLAAGPIVPGGADELVLAAGLYGACADTTDCGGAALGTFVSRGRPTQGAWRDAAVVDLNGDGVVDAVASHDGGADVDVVRGGATPNVYRANTSEPITGLVAGDFDGDRLGDVAMVESSPPGDRLVVLFGTREATVAEPAPMSRFEGRLQLARFTRIPWFPSRRGTDGIDDLLVLDPGKNAVGIVVGDAGRLMTTPRLPPPMGPPQPAPPLPMILPPLGAVVAGAFGSPMVEALAVTQDTVRLYNVRGNAWAPEIMIDPPGLQLHPPMGALRDGPSTRAAARGGGPNEVVVFSVRDGLFASCTAVAAGQPLDLRGLDIDGNEVDEVVVRYANVAGNRAVQVIRSAGCAPEPQLTELLADCVDVAGIGGDRLLAVCRDGEMGARNLYAIVRSGGGFAREAVDADLDGDVNFLTAGDLDGDGVLDVALGVRRGGALAVQVLRQCPAHDTRACSE